MKLLSKQEARSKVKKENDELIDQNIRLRQLEKGVISRLNMAKLDYSPEKVAALKEFDDFVKDLRLKKGRLLKEYSNLEAAVEQKKEVYYGLIEKQDQLDEKIYQMGEKERKLDLRENFVLDLEQKFREKTQ